MRPSPPSKPIWLPAAPFAAFAAAGTNAHRLCSSGEGWVERLGDDALIGYKTDAAREALAAGLADWGAQVGWAPRRVFAKFLPRQNAERVSPTLLAGDAALPATAVVQEAGVRYGIDFSAGYSHGLFLDQRANRAFLRRVAPKRLLNTFAYTCSFSVVAALAGAETLSVDLSKKSLDRGRENFALNDLAVGGEKEAPAASPSPAKAPSPGGAARHRFLADDVLEVLPRLARRGEKFDAIVLDPPTFSRGNQGRRWQVEQHFEDLLNAALELAGPETRLLLSTNCAKLDITTLERTARFCAKVLRRGAAFHREPALPDFPPGHGASTLWMTVR